MALKQFALLFTFMTVLNWATSAEPVRSDVLSRLTHVEDKILTVQKENGELRLENKKLLLDNEELKASFRILEREFETQKKESQGFKRRLEAAEHEISTFKSLEVSLKEANILDENSSIHLLWPKRYSSKPSVSRKEKSLTEKDSSRRPPNHIKSAATTSKLSSVIRQFVPGHRVQVKRLLLNPPSNAVDASKKVSFSVHLGPHTRNMGVNQKIIFDIINNNEGGGYDKMTGVFTCPASGTYFFNAGILSMNAEEVTAAISVNNVDRAYMDAEARPGDGNAHSSNSLIIHCNKGDEVWIKHIIKDSNDVNGGKYSHFCGFMIWAD